MFVITPCRLRPTLRPCRISSIQKNVSALQDAAMQRRTFHTSSLPSKGWTKKITFDIDLRDCQPMTFCSERVMAFINGDVSEFQNTKVDAAFSKQMRLQLILTLLAKGDLGELTGSSLDLKKRIMLYCILRKAYPEYAELIDDALSKVVFSTE